MSFNMLEQLKRFIDNHDLGISITIILFIGGIFLSCWFIEQTSENNYRFTSSTIEEDYDIYVLDPNITFSNDLVFTIRKENVTNFSEDEEYYYISTNMVWER